MKLKKLLAGLLSCALAGCIIPYGNYNVSNAPEASALEFEMPELQDFESDIFDETTLNYTENGLDIDYYIMSDGTACITKCNSFTGTSLVIPSVIKGATVSTIGTTAFQKMSITSLTLPSTLTTLKQGAFFGCNGLTTVTIPASVTSIADQVFSGCNKLSNISVESGNKKYGAVDGVLFDLTTLYLVQYPLGKTWTTYYIPSDVKGITAGAFEYSQTLEHVVFPRTLEKIGFSAFYRCAKLKSASLFENVNSIETRAFADNSDFTLKISSNKCTFPGTSDSTYNVVDSDAKIIGCKNSKTQTYAQAIGVEFEPMFTWGVDNLYSTNSSGTTGFKNSTYLNQIIPPLKTER